MKSLVPVALVASLAISLSGCSGVLPGGGEQPGQSAPTKGADGRVARPGVEELLNDAVANAKAASSLSLKGDVLVEGEQIAVEMEGQVDGSNQRMKMSQKGQNMEMLTVDGKTYASPLDAATADALGMPKESVGKFMELPEAGQMDGMNLGAVLEEFANPERMNVLQKANIEWADVNVQGRPAWRLKEKVGGDGAEIVVAADGQPDLLEVSSPKDGKITFSKWNQAQRFTAPAADKIFRP